MYTKTQNKNFTKFFENKMDHENFINLKPIISDQETQKELGKQ